MICSLTLGCFRAYKPFDNTWFVWKEVSYMKNASHMKETIFREAAAIFRKKSYLGSTLRELAKRCAIQGGSIYYHFASKQDILFKIMDRTMTDLTSSLKREIARHDDPTEELRAAIYFHIRFHIEHPDETYVTDTELRNLTTPNYNIIATKRRNYERIFMNLLTKGVSEGVMEVKDIRIITYAILQMCTAVSYWFRKNGLLSVDEIASIYSEFILSGVSIKRKAFDGRPYGRRTRHRVERRKENR